MAANPGEVDRRIVKTVVALAETLASVLSWNRALRGYPATPPMPVLQGWWPQDYVRCAERIERFVLDGPGATEAFGQPPGPRAQWPDLVGIGSVCRRHLLGPDGVFRILDAVEAALPRRVRFHLFGVRSDALERLKERPRVASIDSMAWNKHARWEAYKQRAPNDKARLVKAMNRWVHRQRQRARPGPQLTLSLS